MQTAMPRQCKLKQQNNQRLTVVTQEPRCVLSSEVQEEDMGASETTDHSIRYRTPGCINR